MEAKNKKAYFDYEILKEIECGISLFGSEIKSIRNGNVNLKDSYGRVKNNEIYVINMFIGKYEESNIFNHEERRERKLLLHKKEILKLKESVMADGLTLVPLKIYIKGRRAKVLLGLCRGKKLYDKRQSIKERDIKIEQDRELSEKSY